MSRIGNSRFIFILKPGKDQSESIEYMVKKFMIVCGKNEKKRKSERDGDESNDDIYKAKKNIKSTKQRRNHIMWSSRVSFDSLPL
ncbi:hypothetical protein AgCh_011459 [Apium graveolens]